MSSVAPVPRLAQLLTKALQARRQWQWLLVILVGLVCYLAFTPMPPKPVGMLWDKFNHLAAFSALTFAGSLGYAGTRRTLVLVMLALLALGGLIEVVQAFVPGRSSEWEDLLADAIGIALGALLVLPLLRTVGAHR